MEPASPDVGFATANEFMIRFAMLIVLVVLPLILALWIHRDATNHDDPQAVVWAVGTALAWPVVLIVYLLVRGQRRQPPQG